MLDPRRFGEALKRFRRTQTAGEETRRLKAVLARLQELEKRRDGLIDLAADGIMGREELRERLAPLDAQIGALKEEADGLERQEDLSRQRERNEGLVLKRLEAMSGEGLDRIKGANRRRAYDQLDLEVLAHRDKSLIITWFMDQEIGRIWCQNDRTSTR